MVLNLKNKRFYLKKIKDSSVLELENIENELEYVSIVLQNNKWIASFEGFPPDKEIVDSLSKILNISIEIPK